MGENNLPSKDITKKKNTTSMLANKLRQAQQYDAMNLTNKRRPSTANGNKK